MTDTAALLDTINSVLKAEMPGVTQVVRRRIAAGIHRKLSETIKTRDMQISELNRKVLDRQQELAASHRRHLSAVRNAAKLTIQTMERIYGEESEQPH